MSEASEPKAGARGRFLNLSNVIAILALILAAAEAFSAVIQVNSYKTQALFAEQLKACSALTESANEFRALAVLFEADAARADKDKLRDARDKLIASTRKVETPLDSLDLLAHDATARQTAELARQADRRLLLLDQEDYTPADAKAWIDGFDAQVGRVVTACHKDLLR